MRKEEKGDGELSGMLKEWKKCCLQLPSGVRD